MLITVRVKTGAKREAVVEKEKISEKAGEKADGKSGRRLEVSLREKAERNEANKKLVAVIARHFSVPVGRVKILTGHKRPSKVVSVLV